MKVITTAVVLIACQLTSSQRFPVTSRLTPLRVCLPHQPLNFIETSNQFECLASSAKVIDLDASKSLIQISIENGYFIESHNVTTSDGYKLTTFRIPGGRSSPPRNGKPPVLLLHGWGTSSESWIALPNDKNLAYMLADAGWDVWLGNHRGSTFSMLHETLDANTDLDYWDFSLHEIGKFDFPAMLEQVQIISGHRKSFVIGHSQGAAAVLVGASEVANINDKIHAAYLMAPAAYLGGVYEPFLKSLLPLANTPIEELLYSLFKGRISIQGPPILNRELGMRRFELCQPKPIRCGLCDLYTWSPYHFNPAKANYTNLPRLISKLFDTGTIRSAIHFGQNARSCTFRYYNYGPRENQIRYGSVDPPNYELRKIKASLYIFWGEGDAMVSPSDIQRLVNDLPPEALRDVIRVNDNTFEHTDFVSARDANVLVYKPLINMMNVEWEQA